MNFVYSRIIVAKFDRSVYRCPLSEALWCIGREPSPFYFGFWGHIGAVHTIIWPGLCILLRWVHKEWKRKIAWPPLQQWKGGAKLGPSSGKRKDECWSVSQREKDEAEDARSISPWLLFTSFSSSLEGGRRTSCGEVEIRRGVWALQARRINWLFFCKYLFSM